MQFCVHVFHICHGCVSVVCTSNDNNSVTNSSKLHSEQSLYGMNPMKIRHSDRFDHENHFTENKNKLEHHFSFPFSNTSVRQSNAPYVQPHRTKRKHIKNKNDLNGTKTQYEKDAALRSQSKDTLFVINFDFAFALSSSSPSLSSRVFYTSEMETNRFSTKGQY